MSNKLQQVSPHWNVVKPYTLRMWMFILAATAMMGFLAAAFHFAALRLRGEERREMGGYVRAGMDVLQVICSQSKIGIGVN